MENILEKLFKEKNESNILIDLTNLNELFRSNESLRQQTPELFYSIINEILNEHLNTSDTLVSNQISELALKCLKNSSAAHKTSLCNDETRLCRLLIEYTNKNLSNTKLRKNALIFIMQYFFNLIQGNEKVLDLFLDEFILICSLLLSRSFEIEFDFINLTAMILMNIFTKRELKLVVLEFDSYVDLINCVFKHTEIDLNTIDVVNSTNWPFKLINHLFDQFYQTDNFYFDFNQLSLDKRFNTLQMLKFKVNHFKSYSNFKCVDYLIKQFDITNLNLNDLIQTDIESNTLLKANYYLNELKLISNCIGDLLMGDIQDTKCLINYAQSNLNLLKNTCDLFRLVNENVLVRKVLDLDESTRCDFKLELIRLIGVLVYENLLNQNLLVDYKVLNLIANNLNIDMDNLFLREWSIVALKHVLDKLDLK